MDRTVAKTPQEALRWIVDHEHHLGSKISLKRVGEGLLLAGANKQLFIRAGLVADLMQPSDFQATRRMFEPNEAGLRLIKQ